MTCSLPLHLVSLDESFHVRAGINDAMIDGFVESMQAGLVFPPIVVFQDGDAYHLADGFHRCHAAQQIGWTEIAADVHAGTKLEALWHALGANKANGLRLTYPDKRRAVRLALKAFPERSGRQIAAQVGCSPQYVSTIRCGLSTTCDRVERIVTTTGQVRLATPTVRQQARDQAAVLLRQGMRVEDVCKQLHIGRDAVHEIRHGLGIGINKSPEAVRVRREQMREMAATGHTSRQIAAELGLSEEGTRATLRELGVPVIADQLTRGLRKHDSNRIVSRIVLDASVLLEGINFINFDDLARDQVPEWLSALKESRDNLNAFIRRLTEVRSNGEAA